MQNMKNKNGYLQSCGSLKKTECHFAEKWEGCYKFQLKGWLTQMTKTMLSRL